MYPLAAETSRNVVMIDKRLRLYVFIVVNVVIHMAYCGKALFKAVF